MTVTLRQRNQGGKTSLYLDYYNNGKRKSEYLKLYLTPNPNKVQKEENKRVLRLAEAICSKRRIEIQNKEFGFRDNEKMKGSFLNYMGIIANKKRDSEGNYGNWNSSFKHLKKFVSGDISFGDIDRKFVNDFKDFLNKSAKKKNGELLGQGSKHSYFNKFRYALKQCVIDDILPKNPSEGVEPFKEIETEREFLTLGEVQKLVGVECELPVHKSSFLFSCLTGLRWSDIKKLTWSEIQHSTEMGYYIRFRQKKSKGVETLPISDQAYDLLGDRGEANEVVFKGLEYSSQNNEKLGDWIVKAGISKHITFHNARHTYATLQLTLGTDIYTVSKMLGHKSLKTTQVYAKIIDERKKEAANKIKLDI